MITGNEPAMPHGAWGQQTGTGLTIRQHFAAMAMQGFISSFTDQRPVPSNVAEFAVRCADAIITKLNKNESV